MPSLPSGVDGRWNAVTFEDVLLWTGCALSVLGVVIVQLAWIVAFDSVGLDRVVPDPVMTQFGPALTVAAIPAAVALRRYDRRMAAVVGTLVFVAALVLASWTVGLYAMCGRC